VVGPGTLQRRFTQIRLATSKGRKKNGLEVVGGFYGNIKLKYIIMLLSLGLRWDFGQHSGNGFKKIAFERRRTRSRIYFKRKNIIEGLFTGETDTATIAA